MEAPGPFPPPPAPRGIGLSRSSWLMLGGTTVLALATIALFPRSGGDSPPLASLALVGAIVAAVTTFALYAIVRRDLGLPSRIGASLTIAFALIAIVKFVLAPAGLYEVNAVRALDDLFGSVADPMGVVFTAVAVFGLYALGYWIAFRRGYDDPLPGRRRKRDRTPRRVSLLVIVLIVAAIVITGGGVLLLGMLVLTAPRQYLEFVFSSWAGLGVALALVPAAALILKVFRLFDERPELVAQVGAVITLFWLGLGFLALYHVLWIVYVLVLGSIWPLRTVTPK